MSCARVPAAARTVAAVVVILVGAVACAPTGAPRTDGALRLLIEPQAGLGPLDRLAASARHRVLVALYELSDGPLEAALADAAARGVEVRVVLDHHREAARNLAAATWLDAHGVPVSWAPGRFEAMHDKVLVVDRTAVVMTLNPVAADLADTRDFAVVDRRPADVAALAAVVAADASGRPIVAPVGDDLVWSPGAAPALVALVDSARRSIDLESEELFDPEVAAALSSAAKRGVQVRVGLPTASDDDPALVEELRAAGATVRVGTVGPGWYLHAKAAVVDGRTAFVGSQNLSAASLDRNREAGLVTTAPAVVGPLAAVLASDLGA